MVEGVETSVFDGVGFVETAILHHAISSSYKSLRQVTVPFSFMWEGTETEYKIMNCMRSTYPQQFYRIIREQGEEAVACMKDSELMDAAVKAEIEMIKLAQGAGVDVPEMSEARAQLKVAEQKDYIAERTDQILRHRDHVIYRDALCFDFQVLIIKGLSNLVALKRVEIVPDILTQKPLRTPPVIPNDVQIADMGIEELPDMLTPPNTTNDRVYGIADKFRRKEEDKLAYLANQAEENLI